MYKVIFKYLKYHKINISKKYFENLIVSNANFPSLLGISDVFERLSIPNDIGKINKENLNDLEFPYLLHMDDGEGDLVFVKDKKALVKNTSKLKRWSGTIIKIYPDQNIKNKKNKESLKEEKLTKTALTFFLVSIIALLLISNIKYIFWGDGLLLLCSLLGLTSGYFLVAKDVGVKYASVENFCHSGKENKSGCDEILSSDAAQVFGIVKFSDLVFSYFLFQTILFSISNYLSSGHLIMAILSFLTIPIIFFSIYYQYFKAKTWCRLCLMVNAVLIIQAVVFGFQFSTSLEIIGITFLEVIVSFLLFVIIITALVMVKGYLKEIGMVKIDTFKYKRIAESVSVFSYLLLGQRMVKTTPIPKEIILGNPSAPVKIIMVSNLYCTPCKLQHEIIDELLVTYPEKVNITLRFLMSGKDDNQKITSSHYLISYWLKKVHNKERETNMAMKMLHDWFEMMDLDKFKERYPLDAEDLNEESKYIEEEHFKWVEESGIEKTPTFFINGHLLPEAYSLENLASVIPELAENFQNTQMQVENILLEEV
ncbi:thioredoxin domain-containing protein [Aquimarina sp. 2201CG5-10]|uniref:thioredoxin domain-containing protein n=1 Tax=Aquimarina callyspongiae TaxID=3098150 RepID=UPI002AB44193|nr:thioredoxin domain-containing protein [Aquimarina sp. 2201CG5-10]MDY8138212.1 thioredoxin domain-containing protein [Aquimarina sp. 2201CG5-10]